MLSKLAVSVLGEESEGVAQARASSLTNAEETFTIVQSSSLAAFEESNRLKHSDSIQQHMHKFILAELIINCNDHIRFCLEVYHHDLGVKKDEV